MKTISLLFIMVVASSINAISQESSLHIFADYGPYSVGFKTFYKYDKTRSFSIDVNDTIIDTGKTISRPMQICIWYPALGTKRNKMKYEDYFFLILNETGKVKETEMLKRKTIEKYIKNEGVDKGILSTELNASMRAVCDAQPINSEKFPVIIYGPSFGSTSFENALLFEFLASHGYIVVSSPSMGPTDRGMSIEKIGVETQARDMEFLLGFMHEFSNADINKIIVAGYSYGGLSNVFMAARNKSVDAWIGIDPSIHEIYEYFKESPYYEYTNFSIPMLFVNSLGYMNSLPFYDKLIYSDAYVVDLPKLAHTDFASQFIKMMGVNATNEKGYTIMVDYILGFLDGIFKKNYDYQEMKNIVFNERDIDSAFIKLRSKKGLPTIDELFAENKDLLKNKATLFSFLNSTISKDSVTIYPEADIQKLLFIASESGLKTRTGELMEWYMNNYPGSFHAKVLKWIDFNKMTEMFIEIYKINSNECTFTYGELNHTGHILLMGNRKQEAIEYFKFNTILNPKNYKAFFNLGIGYFKLNDFNNARINFKKSLDLNPDSSYRGLANEMLLKCN